MDLLRTLILAAAGYLAAIVGLVLYRKMTDPNRALIVHALNILLWLPKQLKVGPFKHSLSIEGACKAACKKRKTNVTDLGDLKFMDSYRAVMESSVVKKQTFTPMGFIVANAESVQAMVRRVDFVRFYRQMEAELSKVPIQAPVFVMGLPRTGTTFLHRLLSLDPAARAPLSWELLSPIPKAKLLESGMLDHDSLATDRKFRRKNVDARLKRMKQIGGNILKHIHEVDTDLPEECLLALTNDMPLGTSYLFSGFTNCDVLKELDSKSAFVNYRKMLQVLSWQIGERTPETSRRWTLKCPGHLLWINGIKAAFPDARIVWTHRHPVNAVPSMCSLNKALHSVFYEPSGLNISELGQQTKRGCKLLVETAQQDFRDSGLQHAHVKYDELVKDPIATVRTIYDSWGMEFTSEYETTLREFLEADRAKRSALRHDDHSKLHSYTPEQFGMTSKEITEDFKSYIDEFNIPEPKKYA